MLDCDKRVRDHIYKEAYEAISSAENYMAEIAFILEEDEEIDLDAKTVRFCLEDALQNLSYSLCEAESSLDKLKDQEEVEEIWS